MSDKEMALLTRYLICGKQVYVPCWDEREARRKCVEYSRWLREKAPSVLRLTRVANGMHEVATVGGGVIMFRSFHSDLYGMRGRDFYRIIAERLDDPYMY